MKQEKLIQKYFAQQLSKEEEKAFKLAYENDEAFKKEVEFQKSIQKVATFEERIKLKSYLDTIKINTYPTQKQKILVLILFVIVIILFLYISLSKTSSNATSIYAEYYQTYPNTYYPVTRTPGDSLAMAFTAYENEGYKLAAELFDDILKRGNESGEILFYTSLTYNELNLVQNAINLMEMVPDNIPIYGIEKYWYLGLYYLNQNQIDKSKENLIQYSKMSDDKKKKQKVEEIIINLNG